MWPSERTEQQHSIPRLRGELSTGAQPTHLASASRTVIEETVAQVFDVKRSEIDLQTRGKAPTALARQVAMYLAHTALGITMRDTGSLFRRDRTTVSHACGLIEDRRDDPIFDRALELLEWAVVARLLSHRFGKPHRI